MTPADHHEFYHDPADRLTLADVLTLLLAGAVCGGLVALLVYLVLA